MMHAPSLDMHPDHLRIVRDLLREHVPDRTVWAFGSRATGRAKKYSDLDIAVLGDKPMTIAQSATLAEAFSESDLPWKVDVVDWVLTDARFRAIIEQEKVILQEAHA
jgi:type I restriction enzyme S subunit